MTLPLPESLLEPLEGDSPTGPFLAYHDTDTTYADVQEAIREDDDAHLPQGEWARDVKLADFPTASRLCIEALDTKSKDLKLAAWLSESLLAQEGFPGLTAGVRLVIGLMQNFWDGVHPPIDEDGDTSFRVSPLRYLETQIVATRRLKRVACAKNGLSFEDYEVSKTVPTEEAANADREVAATRASHIEAGRTPPEDFEEAYAATSKAFYKDLYRDATECKAAVEELKTLTQELVEEDPPVYVQLRSELDKVVDIAQSLLKRRLQEDPDPEEEPDVMEDADGGMDDSGGNDGAGGGQAVVELKTTQDAADFIDRAAQFLREQNPADPGPYVMIRAFRWSELRNDKGSLDPRLLAAPPTQLRTRLKGLLLDGKWDQLLDQCEKVMATPYGRGWLDLQRYVIAATTGLGPDYDIVADGVKRALKDLLRRIPDLIDMTLMDDTSTANNETRRWLYDEGLLGGAEEDEPTFDAMPMSTTAAAPKFTLPPGNPDRAVQSLLGKANREASERGKFLLKSQAAYILVEKGRAEAATPLLREAVRKIDEHQLENWEGPETVAMPLALLYRGLNAIGEGHGELDELYSRVCRIDPVLGMSLKSAPEPEAEAAEAAAEPEAHVESEAE